MKNSLRINWVDIVIFISTVSLSFLLTFDSERLYKIKYTFPAIVAVLFYFIFISKSICYKKDKISKTDIFLSLLFTVPFSVHLINSIQDTLLFKLSELSGDLIQNFPGQLLSNNKMFFVLIIAFISLISFVYLASLFISTTKDGIIDFFKNLSLLEKGYLIAFSIFVTISTVVIYHITSIFYLPTYNQQLIGCDVLLQSDTGGLVSGDVFSNIAGSGFDIKQPLFGVFSLPFGFSAKFLSYIFFFSPISYYIFIGIFQSISILLIAVLLGRLMNLNTKDKAYFLLFYTLSFPSIIFSLNLEQYIFPTFWLIVFIYNSITKEKINNYLFSAAFGTILTNGFIFLPSLLFYYKSIKQKISISLKSIAIFVSIILFSGLMFIFEFPEKIIESEVNASSQVNGIYHKSVKYSHFVTLNFISPIVDFKSQSSVVQKNIPIIGEKEYKGYNLIGIIIFIVALIGYMFNYKDKFIIVSFYWVLFSMLFLMILGWGSIQNAGMFLCSIMYSWAFICLVFNAIINIFKQRPIFKFITFAAILTFMTCYNLYYLFKILEFAKLNYPGL